MIQTLAAVLHRELAPTTVARPPRGFVVAFSGGPDSLALLDLLQQLRKRSARWRRCAVRAVHVDHGLQAASGAWARQCRALCRELDVPLTVRRVHVRTGGRSLEAAAREARYAALAKGLRSDEVLLTAHHLDDQLETFLLQWLRGSGVAGLAAMPVRAAFGHSIHLRPLLEISRDALASWIESRALQHVLDPSNDDDRFDRNFLRAQIVPRLRRRWPAVATVSARTARHLGEAKELLADLAALDLHALRDGSGLGIAALATLSPARQRNVLRHWLLESGLPLPDARHLERIRSELPRARIDAQPLVRWPGAEVRRFRGKLYAYPIGQSTDLAAPSARSWRWHDGAAFVLGPGRGRLRLIADPAGPIAATGLPARLQVRTRHGGERLRSADGSPSVTLKEWLRRSAVLPWQRAALPLVFAGEHLLAVADLAVDARFARKSKQRQGFRLVWEDAPRVRD